MSSEDNVGISMDVRLEIQFRVAAETTDDELVYIVGSQPQLGSWRHRQAVRMVHTTNAEDRIWTKTIEFKSLQDIEFRYFIARVGRGPQGTNDINVVRWEAAKDPRRLSPRDFIKNGNQREEIDSFGIYGKSITVLPGWLTHQTELVVQLHSNPLEWFQPRTGNGDIRVRCTPINAQGTTIQAKCPYKSHCLVSVLRDGHHTHRQQSQFGEIFRNDDVMIFTFQTIHPGNTFFRLEFWLSSAIDSEQNPEFLGYSLIIPPDEKADSHGKSTWLIEDKSDTPVGKVRVDCVVIRPVEGLEMTMDTCYQKHWNREEPVLKMGHRGLGEEVIEDKRCRFIENSISSFSSTKEHGLYFVEMDVLLSKDLVPVIYHDYYVHVSCKKKKKGELPVIKLPVKEFDLQTLQSIAVFHPSTKASHNDGEDGSVLDTLNDQPFPTLQQCLEIVPEDIGFNIEIKYPLELESGEWEDNNYPCRNKYFDALLRVVFQCGGKRKIILSCFDPNTCHYLKLKQNRYPVVFLSMGENILEWTPYKDPRARTVHLAKLFALSMDLLGVGVYANHFLEKPELAREVTKSGLILITWGRQNNVPENVEKQINYGVQSVILDKWYMDHLTAQK